MDEVTLRIYRIDLGEDIWISATSPEEAVPAKQLYNVERVDHKRESRLRVDGKRF